jgi:hypothetical protein
MINIGDNMNSLENRALTVERKKRVVNYVTRSWAKGIAAGWAEIVAVAEIPKGSMPRVMRDLEYEKKVICIGTALDAGRTDMRGSYKVFAPFGTPVLAKVEPKHRRLTSAPAPRKPAYRGEPAGKEYRNWRTPEITMESYNLYEGRQLAMDGPR